MIKLGKCEVYNEGMKTLNHLKTNQSSIICQFKNGLSHTNFYCTTNN